VYIRLSIRYVATQDPSVYGAECKSDGDCPYGVPISTGNGTFNLQFNQPWLSCNGVEFIVRIICVPESGAQPGFDSFYVRVSTMTAIWTVGHRLRSTPTNGQRFTALGLPWRSPLQVLAEMPGSGFQNRMAWSAQSSRVLVMISLWLPKYDWSIANKKHTFSSVHCLTTYGGTLLNSNFVILSSWYEI